MALDRPILARHHRPTKAIVLSLGAILLFLPMGWLAVFPGPGLPPSPRRAALPVVMIIAQLGGIALSVRALSPASGRELPPGRLSRYARERLLAALTPRRRAIVLHHERRWRVRLDGVNLALTLIALVSGVLVNLVYFGGGWLGPAGQWGMLVAAGFLICLLFAITIAVGDRGHDAWLDARLLRLFRGLCPRCTYRLAMRQDEHCPECGQRVR